MPGLVYREAADATAEDELLGKDEESEASDIAETLALEEAKDANKGGGFQPFTMASTGRVSKPSEKYVAGVGVGLGGGFTHECELKAMKSEEAMAADQEG
eukprot:11157008-Ditylum_brightwellii.AAC.1